MPIIIDIHSDVICPWCWIGKRRLEEALAGLAPGAAMVRWHAYQLNPGMPAGGMPRAEYRRRKFGSAEHAAARDAQVTTVAARAGLVFDLAGQRRTPNTVLAHRLIWLAGRRGVQDAVVEELFSAYFSAGLDVGDAAVLARIGGAHGLDGVGAFLAGSEGAEEVQSEEDAIRARGIDGVPLFVINGQERLAGAQPAAEFSALFAQVAAASDASGDCADGVCKA